MRKFRNAALAAATATAVALGGTTVAVAQDNPAPEQPAASAPADTNNAAPADTNNDGGSSAKSNGQNIFGKQTNWSVVPSSWKALYAGTWILGFAAVFALLIAPLDNFLKYGPGK